ncbi:ADP-ribosylation factor-like protein 5A isoform X1 [Mustelus asterias]
MGIIFTKLWRLFNHQEHKVIIVGLDNAGKTTILYQFSMNEVVHTSPTIGSNVEEIVVNNTHFLMWDIGGQESLRSSWNTYYTNTEFVIVVVDSMDRERIAITRDELYKMLAHEDLKKAGLLIFANKQDVKECMTVAEISQYLKLTSIKDHQWHIQACCALTGEGFPTASHLLCLPLCFYTRLSPRSHHTGPDQKGRRRTRAVPPCHRKQHLNRYCGGHSD